MYEIHLKVISVPQHTPNEVIALLAGSRPDFSVVGDRGLQSPTINLVTNPVESFQTYPVITAYTESLEDLASVIEYLLAKDTIVEAYTGSFDDTRASILFEPDAPEDDDPRQNEGGWDAIVQGANLRDILAHLDNVFSDEDNDPGGSEENFDQASGTFMAIPQAKRHSEFVLPQGDRCIFGTTMRPEHAIEAFMARCGFEGYHVLSEDGIMSAAASSGTNGVDMVGVPYRMVIPDNLSGYTFFQIYPAGETRRADDTFFAKGLGYFARVSSGWEENFLSGSGPLWIAGGQTEMTQVTLRM